MTSAAIKLLQLEKDISFCHSNSFLCKRQNQICEEKSNGPPFAQDRGLWLANPAFHLGPPGVEGVNRCVKVKHPDRY